MDFDPGNGLRRIDCGGAAGGAISVVAEPLLEVSGTPDIKSARLQAKKVNKGDAPRQARGHSVRFSYEIRPHGVVLRWLEAMSKRSAPNGSPSTTFLEIRVESAGCGSNLTSGGYGFRKNGWWGFTM